MFFFLNIFFLRFKMIREFEIIVIYFFLLFLYYVIILWGKCDFFNVLLSCICVLDVIFIYDF